MAGIYLVKRTQTFVEAGLLGVLLLFAFMFGIGWHHYATGICLGFGIYGGCGALGDYRQGDLWTGCDPFDQLANHVGEYELRADLGGLLPLTSARES
jgi:hypothetical protein